MFYKSRHHQLILSLILFFLCALSVSVKANYPVTTGENHTCAIDDNGVICWGSNDKNQTDVPPALSNPIQISAGTNHNCALDDNGVSCWGDYLLLTPFPTLSNPIQVSAGADHNCALDGNGVTCWGSTDVFGQITVPTTLSNPTQVSAGTIHSCALDDSDSGVTCWGDDRSGQSSVPSTLINPRYVSAGGYHTCALDDNGMSCWGLNNDGQSDVPVDLINPRQVSAGRFHTCAIDDNGARCWGRDDDGQSSVPTIPPLSNPVLVSAGSTHSCALDDTGVICWGDNTDGKTTVPAELSLSGCSTNSLIVSNIQYDVDKSLQSELSINTDGVVVVKNGVNVSYQAPVITLKPGFHAEAGSQFTATAVMDFTCTPEALLRSSSTQPLVSTAETEQLLDIQITQTSEYLVAQWLTATELPQSLQQLLTDNNAIANEIQSDASGNIIVFSSTTALLDNDANAVSDIYAYQIPTDSLSLISHSFDNSSGNGSSTQARINGSGNYIIYRSEANNLSSSENHIDDNNAADIYLYNIADKQTIRVSWEEDGSQTQHNASNPSIAGNEPYMVYEKGDNFHQQHIYGVDSTVGSLSGIKYSTDYNNFAELIDNSQPGISADGRYVVYLGQSKDENNTCTQHILDRLTGNSQIMLCPDQIAENPEQWFPFFDSKAENVLWQQVK